MLGARGEPSQAGDDQNRSARRLMPGENHFQGGGSILEIGKPFPPSVNYGNTVSRAIPGCVSGLDRPGQRAAACQYSFKTPEANAHTKPTIN